VESGCFRGERRVERGERIEKSGEILINKKTEKTMNKTWKTVIQFLITVLTAAISSFAVQSCITM
jgi:hypothetical protein